MSSSVHIYNKNKDVWILCEGPSQGLDHTTLTREAQYPINFTKPRKRFVLTLQYNGSNSLLFVNATKKPVQSKRLWNNISKYVTVNNMKK